MSKPVRSIAGLTLYRVFYKFTTLASGREFQKLIVASDYSVAMEMLLNGSSEEFVMVTRIEEIERDISLLVPAEVPA